MDADGPVACHTVMDDPDGELVAAARAGSREAAGELFARHWDDARRVALAVVRRDALGCSPPPTRPGGDGCRAPGARVPLALRVRGEQGL